METEHAPRILLVDPSDERRAVLVPRLRAQGYDVDEASDGAVGAEIALGAPPAAVVANLWMPSVSGLQLCRMLRSEPATSDVPVVLCAEREEPRNHFWAEHAGATACVVTGRTGELVRVLERAISGRPPQDEFFVQLGGGGGDVRDRIARHLDAALFDSVISGELRALASAATFDRLFDRLAQLMTRLTRYRWLALARTSPMRLVVHAHPRLGAAAAVEARRLLDLDQGVDAQRVEDEDAVGDARGPQPLVRDVSFAGAVVARLAVAPCVDGDAEVASLADAMARELGSAVRMTGLLEELERSATTDALTGLMNRRAFAARMTSELSRCSRHGYPLALALLDVDHFKRINDGHGHAAGDRVLAALGGLLARQLRASDFAARWGGEEIVVALASTDAEGGRMAAERLRAAVQALVVTDADGANIPVTVSVGVAGLRSHDTLESLVEQADRAMYASKQGGRNRVTLAGLDVAPCSAERVA
jgi:two-component system cell cycle response regulator